MAGAGAAAAASTASTSTWGSTAAGRSHHIKPAVRPALNRTAMVTAISSGFLLEPVVAGAWASAPEGGAAMSNSRQQVIVRRGFATPMPEREARTQINHCAVCCWGLGDDGLGHVGAKHLSPSVLESGARTAPAVKNRRQAPTAGRRESDKQTAGAVSRRTDPPPTPAPARAAGLRLPTPGRAHR